MLSPCYECTQRTLGWHSSCSLYRQFSESREAARRRQHQEYAIEAVRGECLNRYKEKERRTPRTLIRRK